MQVNSSPDGITAIIVLACACFVIFIRTRNWLDSNFPIVFYLGLVGYAATLEDRFPPYLVYGGLALGGLLRFEFMSPNFTRVIKFCEFGVLGAIVYFTAGSFIQF
jgi:hypothetical protein